MEAADDSVQDNAELRMSPRFAIAMGVMFLAMSAVEGLMLYDHLTRSLPAHRANAEARFFGALPLGTQAFVESGCFEVATDRSSPAGAPTLEACWAQYPMSRDQEYLKQVAVVNAWLRGLCALGIDPDCRDLHRTELLAPGARDAAIAAYEQSKADMLAFVPRDSTDAEKFVLWVQRISAYVSPIIYGTGSALCLALAALFIRRATVKAGTGVA